MERFVFVSAIILAACFGIAALVGNSSHFSFSIDDEGGSAPIVDVAAGSTQAQAYQGTELRLKHLAAIVTITPEDRTDFLIEINSPGGTPMPTVSAEEGRVVVDGQLRGRISGCADDGGASLRGYENVTVDQLPRITIRAPRTLTVARSGAGTTEIGSTETLALEIAGCGDATIGDVAGEFRLEAAGAGDVAAGAVRRVEADIAGAGDISVGAVAEAANVELAGAGTFTMASLTGELSLSSAGAGDVVISGGSLTRADIELAGAGNVRIAAPVQVLDVQIVGVSDVDVTGAVGDLDAEIAGPGNVTVGSVTGTLRQDIAGPGSVNVGSR
jgi:hypothetical protein